MEHSVAAHDIGFHICLIEVEQKIWRPGCKFQAERYPLRSFWFKDLDGWESSWIWMNIIPSWSSQNASITWAAYKSHRDSLMDSELLLSSFRHPYHLRFQNGFRIDLRFSNVQIGHGPESGSETQIVMFVWQKRMTDCNFPFYHPCFLKALIESMKNRGLEMLQVEFSILCNTRKIIHCNHCEQPGWDLFFCPLKDSCHVWDMQDGSRPSPWFRILGWNRQMPNSMEWHWKMFESIRVQNIICNHELQCHGRITNGRLRWELLYIVANGRQAAINYIPHCTPCISYWDSWSESHICIWNERQSRRISCSYSRLFLSCTSASKTKVFIMEDVCTVLEIWAQQVAYRFYIEKSVIPFLYGFYDNLYEVIGKVTQDRFDSWKSTNSWKSLHFQRFAPFDTNLAISL
jgi:hypothetical protein